MPDSSFRLAGVQPDADTRKLFAELMKQADRGELVGAIVISLRSRKTLGKQYFLSLAGWASQNPTFAAGAMGACQTILHQMALDQSNRD